jgi:hypothetical protein
MFNYTQVVLVDKSFGVEINVMTDKLATATQGMEFSFLRLLTSSDESTCSDAMAGDALNCGGNDNDDETVQILAILVAVLIVVGCAIFFAVVYFGMLSKREKMSEQSDDNRF